MCLGRRIIQQTSQKREKSVEIQIFGATRYTILKTTVCTVTMGLVISLSGTYTRPRDNSTSLFVWFTNNEGKFAYKAGIRVSCTTRGKAEFI